jgi:asparagine synthase (glutamine-hydrolysing)
VRPLLAGEIAGMHDRRGRADADVLRRAFPDSVVEEAGPFALAGESAWAGPVGAALAGRVQRPNSLREDLQLRPEASIQRVLAAGYARWGDALLKRLTGPFALVAWHRDEQRGVLAQDPLGGRSLFVLAEEHRVLFATEVHLLLRLLRRRPDPDELALAHYLVDHSVPDGHTLFRGIRRLGGGRHLELSDAGHFEHVHWAPRYQPPLRAPRSELAERLRDTLAAAVEDALPSSGSAGLLLSGGLDSSAVAAVAAGKGDLRAVSAHFPDEPGLDETAWATRVTDHVGMSLTTVPIEHRDPLDVGEAYAEAWRLPLPVPGIVIEQPLLAAAARLGADVALDGQGGDEVFGAPNFLIADRVRAMRLWSAWQLARRHPFLGADPPRRHVWRLFTSVGMRGALPASLHEMLRRRRTAYRSAPTWLRPDLAALYRETQDPWRWKRLDGPRWWASLADVLTRGREVADVADYVRRRARMVGVEARSPLLDLHLVELALRLPPETNFDPVTSRRLVREALQGDLPPDVLGRTDKRDFAAFHHNLLQTDAGLDRLRGLLDARGASVSAYVDVGRLHRERLERPAAVGDPGWRSWAVDVWNAATVEQWLRA